jgi:ribose transport system permease protein
MREARPRRWAEVAYRGASAGSGMFGALGILALLVLAFSIAEPGYFTAGNVVNILRQYSVILILAVGQTLVIISAGIDLSVAATAALAGSVMGVAYAHAGWAGWAAVGLGLLTGFAVGLLNGMLIAWWKVPDIIVTLGSLTAVRGVALVVTDGLPVPDFARAVEGRRMPDIVTTVGSGSVGPVPVIVLVAAGCCVIGWYVLNHTRLGRSIVAVGGNRLAAHTSGISVNRTKIAVYGLSGLFAAIGGMALAGRLSSANALMATGNELDTIAAVVIGGTALFGGEGRVSGTVIGVFIIGALANGLNILGVSEFWQRIVNGVIIVAVVALDQWRRRRTAS